MGQDDTKHNLLFISKYPQIIHEFTDAMKDRDIEIETAINGIEAAAKIKKKNYDIVITGLSLEGYNGEQIITYLNKTAPSTVCIIYTTTISSAQLHFFINERNVFRVFLRPVDIRGAFWEALEEAYEYHAVQVKNEEDTGARRQEQEKQEREIEIMDQRMRSQRQARETTNRYMKRLAGLTIKEYTPAALSAEARGHLERIEARTIDFCSEQGEHAAESLDKAEEVLQTVRSFTEN